MIPMAHLNVAALLAVIVLTAAARGNTPAGLREEIWLGLLAVLTTIAARRGRPHRTADACVELAVALLVVASIYESLGPIIVALGLPTRDGWILNAERLLTGSRWPPLAPTSWPPWIFDGLSLAYVAYFGLPIVLAGALVAGKRVCEARASACTLLSCLYLHYAIYLVMPVVGPVRAAQVPVTVRAALAAEGGRLSHDVRRAIGAIEQTPQDSFPSAHTSVAVLVALLARRYRLGIRWAVYPATAAIVVSTIALGYHYVVDVACAAPIVWCAWKVARLEGVEDFKALRPWSGCAAPARAKPSL